MTLGQRFNAKAKELARGQDLQVDPAINSASHIDEIIFRRSEYLGGMASVILTLITKE